MTRAALVVVAACGRVDFGALPAADAPATSHRVLYVATRAPDALVAFAISPSDGALTPLADSPLPAATASPSAIAIDPIGAFAIVAGSGGLATFALDPTTGTPSVLATAASTGFAAVALAPSGQFAYAGNSGDTDYAFAIDRATGAATLVDSMPVQATATFAVVDPAGRFVVTPGEGTSCGLAVSPIDAATGAIGAAVLYRPVACLTDAERAALDATATHVYVAENGNCAIYGYPIDPVTGAVAINTPVAGSEQLAGFDCFLDVELHPSGRWLYASGSGVIVMGVDAATGAIAPRGAAGPNTIADTSINRVVIEPGGAFLYAVSAQSAVVGGQVFGYAIDPATGALAAVPGSPYALGGIVYDLAIGGPVQ